MQTGDKVLIENGRTPGTITAVIESPEQQLAFNVDEPGVMIKSASFGLVFWPSSMEDPVVADEEQP